MQTKFIESADIVAGFVPVDMQTGANTGDWVNLSTYARCVAVLFKAAGTAGDDPVFTLQQATDNAGTSAKALTFTTVWSKVGTLASIAAFTKNTQAAAGTYTDTVSAESQAIMLVEIRAEDLDVSNGFNHIQLSIPDTGTNAQLGCAFYLMLDPLHAGVSQVSAEG